MMIFTFIFLNKKIYMQTYHDHSQKEKDEGKEEGKVSQGPRGERERERGEEEKRKKRGREKGRRRGFSPYESRNQATKGEKGRNKGGKGGENKWVGLSSCYGSSNTTKARKKCHTNN